MTLTVLQFDFLTIQHLSYIGGYLLLNIYFISQLSLYHIIPSESHPSENRKCWTTEAPPKLLKKVHRWKRSDSALLCLFCQAGCQGVPEEKKFQHWITRQLTKFKHLAWENYEWDMTKLWLLMSNVLLFVTRIYKVTFTWLLQFDKGPLWQPQDCWSSNWPVLLHPNLLKTHPTQNLAPST